eukprot:4699175-Amphidinium_carterae.1
MKCAIPTRRDKTRHGQVRLVGNSSKLLRCRLKRIYIKRSRCVLFCYVDCVQSQLRVIGNLVCSDSNLGGAL